MVVMVIISKTAVDLDAVFLICGIKCQLWLLMVALRLFGEEELIFLICFDQC